MCAAIHLVRLERSSRGCWAARKAWARASGTGEGGGRVAWLTSLRDSDPPSEGNSPRVAFTVCEPPSTPERPCLRAAACVCMLTCCCSATQRQRLQHLVRIPGHLHHDPCALHRPWSCAHHMVSGAPAWCSMAAVVHLPAVGCIRSLHPLRPCVAPSLCAAHLHQHTSLDCGLADGTSWHESRCGPLLG